MELDFFADIKIPVTILHVVSVVFGMGSALVSDVLFTFFSKDKKLNRTELATLDILSKVVFYSLFLIILSGITLFLSDVERYSHSGKFLAKITILGILLINGYFLNKFVWSHLLDKNFFTSRKDQNIRKLAFACGAVSVISWIAVCGLGVLDTLPIAYSAIVGIYGAIILFGVIVSLVIEKKEFN
jgi:hypothetical protein